MNYLPTHCHPWKTPDCYIGVQWHGWYSVIGQTRDSDTLERSNYRVAMAHLRVLDREDPGGESTVTDCRESHWACGWLEVIRIHESNHSALWEADRLLECLEQYPVLSEDDWSEMEEEEAAIVWQSWGIAERIAACVRYRVSPFAARHSHVPDDPTGEIVGYLADGR